MSEFSHQRWSGRARLSGPVLALVMAACGAGTIGNGNGGPSGEGGNGSSSPPAGGGGMGNNGGMGNPPAPPDKDVDPGRVTVHRLNNLEYNNTVRDLLGSKLQPATKFLAEEGLHFDNTASALGMTAAQYEGYLGAAKDLVTELAGDSANLARVMTCTPGDAAGDGCAKQIVQSFGFKAFRRPVDAADSDRAMKVFDSAIGRGSKGKDAMLLTIRAMLVSPSFLYRLEIDPNPNSTEVRALNAFELASRLSYLSWSSMPDDGLFNLAKSGDLLNTKTLESEVDRLLSDGKAASFIESFAGQWLDLRKLTTHSVTGQVFPTYTAELADAMAAEGHAWFNEFLTKNRPVTDWFTADFNFVNDLLAQHYGMPAQNAGTTLKRVEVTTDNRKGFLGLASFLTQTSFPSRTSPTLRGVWVLTDLLCSPPPPPPINVPELADSATPAEKMQTAGSENVKERLERHRADPACAGCHRILDPIGLGLERYDGIGRYREKYGDGSAIDPGGVLPEGTKFAGPDELGQLLTKDERFKDCVAKQLYTYALGRDLEPQDTAILKKVQTNWATRDALSIRNLMKEIVTSNAFRFRRGETP